MASKNTRGNRHMAVRCYPDLHAKIGRVSAQTGYDKSAILRSAVEFLSEDQLRQLVTTNQSIKAQSAAVQHAA